MRVSPFTHDVLGKRELTTNGHTRDLLPKAYSGPSTIPSISTFRGGIPSSSCDSRSAVSTYVLSVYGFLLAIPQPCEGMYLTISHLPPGKLNRTESKHIRLRGVQKRSHPHLTSPAWTLNPLDLTSRRMWAVLSMFSSGMRTAASLGVRDDMIV
jgi:hypothetical protein